MSVRLTSELAEDLFDEAQNAGILNNERISALLMMELRREQAWERLNANAALVREAAQADYGNLSDDEIMQLVDEEIHLMRAENTVREKDNRNS